MTTTPDESEPMDITTDTIPMVQFVTARLGERKAIAQDALKRHDPSQPPGGWTATHRVIAQLEATRKIIANARTALDEGWQLGEEAREATAHLAVRTLQHLAAIDANHPDYDPAWQL